MSDRDELRQRIAAVCDKHLRADYLRTHPTWDGYDTVHAERLAVAVLDALGLEQVGWGCVVEDRMAVSSVRAHKPSHAGGAFYEPVYRLRLSRPVGDPE